MISTFLKKNIQNLLSFQKNFVLLQSLNVNNNDECQSNIYQRHLSDKPQACRYNCPCHRVAPHCSRVFTLCKTAVSSENLKNIHSVSPASVFKRIIGRVERGSFTFIVQKRAYSLINRMANSVLTLFKLHLWVLTLLNYSLYFYTIHLCQFYTS